MPLVTYDIIRHKYVFIPLNLTFEQKERLKKSSLDVTMIMKTHQTFLYIHFKGIIEQIKNLYEKGACTLAFNRALA